MPKITSASPIVRLIHTNKGYDYLEKYSILKITLYSILE